MLLKGGLITLMLTKQKSRSNGGQLKTNVRTPLSAALVCRSNGELFHYALRPYRRDFPTVQYQNGFQVELSVNFR
jgi:hypothetical protein